MKKFITLFLLFLYSYINGQVTQIVPFNTYSFSQPNGTYFKDLDNTLNYYEGTWEGILNNKKYTFIFKKKTENVA